MGLSLAITQEPAPSRHIHVEKRWHATQRRCVLLMCLTHIAAVYGLAQHLARTTSPACPQSTPPKPHHSISDMSSAFNRLNSLSSITPLSFNAFNSCNSCTDEAKARASSRPAPRPPGRAQQQAAEAPRLLRPLGDARRRPQRAAASDLCCPRRTIKRQGSRSKPMGRVGAAPQSKQPKYEVAVAAT